ncbi:MAG TPA: CvpA family protein [Candidatus Deferrimicrobiaceae bacterium]|jgi:membrane protein required for colicin V production|nr:CvpA family protein [Candidatus Deferrimicrobiaceae bacterium]
MTTADWLIIAVILLNVMLAAMHGFFAEALSMAGLVVGYLVAAWQYQRLAGWLLSFLNSEMVAEIFGFLIIFFVILMIFSIAGRIARRLMKEVGLSAFDRFLGGLLGLLKGALAVAVILMGMAAFTPTTSLLEKSELAPYFLVVGRAAIWLAPSELRAKFDDGLDFLRHAPRDLSGTPAESRR